VVSLISEDSLDLGRRRLDLPRTAAAPPLAHLPVRRFEVIRHAEADAAVAHCAANRAAAVVSGDRLVSLMPLPLAEHLLQTPNAPIVVVVLV